MVAIRTISRFLYDLKVFIATIYDSPAEPVTKPVARIQPVKPSPARATRPEWDDDAMFAAMESDPAYIVEAMKRFPSKDAAIDMGKLLKSVNAGRFLAPGEK